MGFQILGTKHLGGNMTGDFEEYLETNRPITELHMQTESGKLRISLGGTDLGGRAGKVLTNVLVDALSLFVTKAADYEGSFFTADLLGARGQFADMWRKFGKLHKAIWLGEPLEGEQPDEIVRDFIGHCLLTLDYLQRGDDNGEHVAAAVMRGLDTGAPTPNRKPCICDDLEIDDQCPKHG